MKSAKTRCIEALLNGQVLCEVFNDDLFIHCKEHTDELNEFFDSLDRTLATTSDEKGFYLVYKRLDDEEERKNAYDEFTRALRFYEPLLMFIAICRDTTKDNTPVAAGDKLYFGNLLNIISSSDTLSHKLNALCTRIGIKKENRSKKEQLEAVFKFLTDTGFVVSFGPSGNVFCATAKFSLLYDELEFLDSTRGKAMDEKSGGSLDTSQMQTELF